MDKFTSTSFHTPLEQFQFDFLISVTAGGFLIYQMFLSSILLKYVGHWTLAQIVRGWYKKVLNPCYQIEAVGSKYFKLQLIGFNITFRVVFFTALHYLATYFGVLPIFLTPFYIISVAFGFVFIDLFVMSVLPGLLTSEFLINLPFRAISLGFRTAGLDMAMLSVWREGLRISRGGTIPDSGTPLAPAPVVSKDTARFQNYSSLICLPSLSRLLALPGTWDNSQITKILTDANLVEKFPIDPLLFHNFPLSESIPCKIYKNLVIACCNPSYAAVFSNDIGAYNHFVAELRKVGLEVTPHQVRELIVELGKGVPSKMIESGERYDDFVLGVLSKNIPEISWEFGSDRRVQKLLTVIHYFSSIALSHSHAYGCFEIVNPGSSVVGLSDAENSKYAAMNTYYFHTNESKGVISGFGDARFWLANGERVWVEIKQYPVSQLVSESLPHLRFSIGLGTLLHMCYDVIEMRDGSLKLKHGLFGIAGFLGMRPEQALVACEAFVEALHTDGVSQVTLFWNTVGELRGCSVDVALVRDVQDMGGTVTVSGDRAVVEVPSEALLDAKLAAVTSGKIQMIPGAHELLIKQKRVFEAFNKAQEVVGYKVRCTETIVFNVRLEPEAAIVKKSGWVNSLDDID